MDEVESPIHVGIRPEIAPDIAGIGAVHRAAFRRKDETRLVDRLRKWPGFDPNLSLVALHGAEIVGHILFSPVAIESKDVSTPAMALGPLAVVPPWQRKGVGSQLMRRGLAACREAGHRFIVVIGHPRYYPRFGFVMAEPLGIECPFPVPPETFMFLDLTPEKGSLPRGRVQYPAPFLGLPETQVR
jgi:putative acetyltransferase